MNPNDPILNCRNSLRNLWLSTALVVSTGPFLGPAVAAGLPLSARLQAVPFAAVTIDDQFWSPRQRVNRSQTIPHLISMCELEGRVRNLLRAGGKLDGAFEGARTHDADLFKVIEAASYVLANTPDSALDSKLDQLIAAIAGAQQADGFLQTYWTMKERGDRSRTALSSFADGHLIDAGIAHSQVTGKTTLLDVARRAADLIHSLNGPGRRAEVPQHPKIETSLVQLHRVTGEKRYLDLARYWIEERGQAERSGRKPFGLHYQDHLPIREQHQAEGHVICGLFLWTGAFDLGVTTGDRTLVQAARRVFDDAVSRRMYVTGAMGRAWDERFTEPYALENHTSIGEGCQSAALLRLAQRFLLFDADARHADLIERVLYNNLAADVSLDGRRFYYVNRLSARPEHAKGRPYRFPHTRTEKSELPRFCLDRQPWFTVPCCPPNTAMALATLGEHIYATSADAIVVNQFIGSRATVSVGRTNVTVEQTTGYPWTGNVALRVLPRETAEFTVRIRIPDWCRELESTGGLYRPRESIGLKRVALRLNAKPLELGPLDKGYAQLHRRWQQGDTVELELPMEILRVESHPAVEGNRGRIALQRGPMIYSAEAVDHGGRVRDLVLPAHATLRAEVQTGLLNGVTVVRGNARRDAAMGAAGPVELLAVPYAVWGNREIGEMDVWLAEEPTPPARVVLVQNGKPVATIVIAAQFKKHPDMETPAQLAAEFNRWARRISGAELPVLTDADARDDGKRPLVLLGESALTRAAGVDVSAQKPETICIRTVGNKLVLIGTAPQGDRSAIHSFFQRVCDVRWLWPGELGTVVPPRETIAVSALAIQETPDFADRRMTFMGAKEWRTAKDPRDRMLQDWLVRNKMAGGSVNCYTGHAFTADIDRFAKEHPEWLAQVKGERAVIGDASHTHPCYSNPEFQKHVIETRIKIWAGRRENLKKRTGWTDREVSKYFTDYTVGDSLSVQDGNGWCECEPCRKMDEPENYNAKGELTNGSDRHLRFANIICEAVTAAEPCARFGVYAYGKTKPPAVRVTPHKALVLSFTDFCEIAPEIGRLSASKLANLKVYGSTYDKMIFRASIGDWKLLPTFYPHRQSEYMATLRDHRVIGFGGADATMSWAIEGFKYYLFARQCWNAGADVDALMEDYCVSAFGAKAAAPMIAYFQAWEGATVTTPTTYTTTHPDPEKGSGADIARAALMIYRPEHLEQMGHAMAAALAAGGTAEQKGRVRFMNVGFEYLRILAGAAEARVQVQSMMEAYVADAFGAQSAPHAMRYLNGLAALVGSTRGYATPEARAESMSRSVARLNQSLAFAMEPRLAIMKETAEPKATEEEDHAKPAAQPIPKTEGATPKQRECLAFLKAGHERIRTSIGVADAAFPVSSESIMTTLTETLTTGKGPMKPLSSMEVAKFRAALDAILRLEAFCQANETTGISAVSSTDVRTSLVEKRLLLNLRQLGALHSMLNAAK